MSNPTNITSLPESVEMAACKWLAKLDRGDLSSEEKAALAQWAREPIHRQALASQMQDWSEMDVLSELSHLDMGLTKSSWVDHLNSFFDWRKPALYLASVVVTLIGLIAFQTSVYTQFPETDGPSLVDFDIRTAVGEQTSESLPDGSVLHVNTTTDAEVSYSEDERSVQLNNGEAFFDVAPDVDRPFVVYAGDVRVRAVGTAFAVHLMGDSVEVLVTEGTVEFTSGGEKRLVSADPVSSGLSPDLGNSVFHSGEQTFIETQPQDVLSRRLAWQSGMLEFRGDPLSRIVEEVGRYTEAEIEILDEDIRDVRIGGYFRIGDIEGMALALNQGFNIKLEVVSEDLIQISRASN